MGKIDCIVEMREEQYNSGFNSGYDDGFEEASLMVARNLLINGFSVDVVLKNISLDEDKISELLNEIEVIAHDEAIDFDSAKHILDNDPHKGIRTGFTPRLLITLDPGFIHMQKSTGGQ